MVATISLLLLINIIVWVVELLRPYKQPDAEPKRAGLLLLLYLPVWAVVSNILLASAYPLFYGRSYFQHGRSAITAVWAGLLLAVVFALLHRPLLSLLGRYILRDKQRLWGVVSAIFGFFAGIVQYLIVRASVPLGPITLVVFSVTSCLIGYCVGYVQSLISRQPVS